MKIMRALIAGFALLALSAGSASAAAASWTIGTVTGVLVRSSWSVSGTSSTEGNPVLLVTFSSGAVFARHILTPITEKSKQMIETARQAAASGKRLGVFADPERIIYAQFCTDYGLTGCIQTTALSTFTMIEDMAIYP